MKKIFYLFIFLLMATRLLANGGGPDTFGYTWKDSNDSLGPAFHWVDIVDPDREVYGLGDDNVRGPYTLTVLGNYPFKFYWYDVDKMWVGANGYISFDNINLSSAFPTIPDPNGNWHNFITGLLADLTFAGAGNPGHCYYKITTDSIIVSWINVPFYSQTAPSWTGSNTFEIILSKLDNSITINFMSSNGTTINNDIRTGIENITGNIGLQPFANIYPPANYTIKYYYPVSATYFVTDGSAKWNTQYGNRGLFLLRQTPFTLNADIGNTGNITIPPNYTATARVNDYSGSNMATSSVTFADSLAGGDDTTFTYPAVFTPAASGIYSYTTRLSGVLNDAFPSNDSVTQELEVVDTTFTSYELNYTDNSAESSLSWTDGTGGTAVYFVPPCYPVKVASTKFFIGNNPNGVSFDAKIFDDSGPNGSPGLLLDSVMCAIPFVGGYNIINPAHNIVINHGGVYVLWEMNGIGISLGTDQTPPFSLRTFEYIAGLWTEYRNSQAEDFLIGLIVAKTQKEDVSIPSIVSPADNAFISAPTTVTCWIKNPGQVAETNFNVNYRLAGSAPVTQMYYGTAIAPSDSVQFTFNTQILPTPGGTGKFCVYTQLNNDFDRTNDTNCITLQMPTALHELSSNDVFSVYPNPFNRQTTIQFTNPDKSPYDMYITDVLGNVVKKVTGIKTNKIVLEKAELNPGVYLLELRGAKHYLQRIVIE